MYWLFERLPKTRDSLRRLGLVTLNQMLTGLVVAIENPVMAVRTIEVPQIRQSSL
jgi:ABC-type iron transport system FetAB permease component